MAAKGGRRAPPPPPPEDDESFYESEPVPASRSDRSLPKPMYKRPPSPQPEEVYEETEPAVHKPPSFGISSNSTEDQQNYDDFYPDEQQQLYDDFDQDLPPPPPQQPIPDISSKRNLSTVPLPAPPSRAMRPKLPDIPAVHNNIQEIYEDMSEELYEEKEETEWSDDDMPPGPPPLPPITNMPRRSLPQEQDPAAPAYPPKPRATSKPDIKIPQQAAGGGFNSADIMSARTKLKPVTATKPKTTTVINTTQDFKSILKSVTEGKTDSAVKPALKTPINVPKLLMEVKLKPTIETKPKLTVKPLMIPQKPQEVITPYGQPTVGTKPRLNLNGSAKHVADWQDDQEIYDDTAYAGQMSPIDGILGPKEPFLYRWYHGSLARKDGEKMLRDYGGSGIFLVRKSMSGGRDQPYTMQVIHNDAHFVLKIRRRTPDGKICLGEEKAGESAFKDIAELVRFHETDEIILMGNQSGSTKLLGYPARI